MKFFRILSLALFTSAASALLAPTPAHAAIVAVTHEKLDHCGRGFVFCNGVQAYSLTEIENGTVPLVVSPMQPDEFVIVNDTGHTVTNLQLTLSTVQFASFDMKCLIESEAKDFFDSCSIAKQDNGLTHSAFGVVSAQLSFSAKDTGVPDGDYFDVKAIGFQPGGYLCGGGTSSTGSTGGTGGTGGTSGNGGSGGNGGSNGNGGSGGNGSKGGGTKGNPGPPQQ